MTVSEILEQAKALSPDERERLIHELRAMQTTDSTKPKTGAEIVEIIEAMPPIEFVDSQIEDPVEWVKAQRRKRQEKLKPYWDGDV